MPIFELNKLVRTGLLAKYEALGQTPEVEVLTGERLIEHLLDKLREEVLEYDSGERTAEGLADIEQVCMDIELILPLDRAVPEEIIEARNYAVEQRKIIGVGEVEIEETRRKKLDDKGGFIEKADVGYMGIRVTRLALSDGDPWVDYYRTDSVRFRELSVEKAPSTPSSV